MHTIPHNGVQILDERNNQIVLPTHKKTPTWVGALEAFREKNNELRCMLRAKITSVEPFGTHSGKIAVYNEDNVDTDRIIPARFLSMITRSGYGELLFHDVRGGDFPLDRREAQGASILVAGTNFGCGSSREHAVWAIQQAGFKAVIALKAADSPGYSDIFRQNAANCGLLLIELPPTDHALLVGAGSGAVATIDLPNLTVQLGGSKMPFELNPNVKDALMKGLDLIGTTLQFDQSITTYERASKAYVPTSEGS